MAIFRQQNESTKNKRPKKWWRLLLAFWSLIKFMFNFSSKNENIVKRKRINRDRKENRSSYEPRKHCRNQTIFCRIKKNKCQIRSCMHVLGSSRREKCFNFVCDFSFDAFSAVFRWLSRGNNIFLTTIFAPLICKDINKMADWICFVVHKCDARQKWEKRREHCRWKWRANLLLAVKMMQCNVFESTSVVPQFFAVYFFRFFFSAFVHSHRIECKKEKANILIRFCSNKRNERNEEKKCRRFKFIFAFFFCALSTDRKRLCCGNGWTNGALLSFEAKKRIK